MNFLINAFNTLLYQPLFNALILLYQYLPGHDFGIAVIVLTILLRLLLYPLMAQAIRSQKALADIQPKIQEAKEKFKDNQERQMKEIMSLYKDKKINPFGMFLPILIQLPVLIALFWVFKNGLQSEEITMLYSFVPHPGQINYLFLGLINLSQVNIPIAVLTSITQFFQLKTQNPKPRTQKKEKKDSMSYFSQASKKQMPYFFSAFTFIFLLKLPAAIALYWMVTSLFSIIQQHVLNNYDRSK